MSPDEIDLLQHIGTAYLVDIGIIVTNSVLYGLYLALFILGTRTLLARRERTNSWILLSILAFLFLFSTTGFASNITTFTYIVRGTLISNPDKPLLDRLVLADESIAVISIVTNWFVGNTLSSLLYVFTDAVVVWRAYVLWPENRVVKVVPLTLLLLSFGSTITSNILGTLGALSGDLNSSMAVSNPMSVMAILSICLSIITNVVATSLIGYKAYQHRRMVKATIGLRNSTSTAILIFLTESGVVFCILQVLTVGLSVSDSSEANLALDIVVRVIVTFLSYAAAAYPLLVLLIVERRLSIADHTGISVDSRFVPELNSHGAARNRRETDVRTPISFAARPVISHDNTRINEPSHGDGELGRGGCGELEEKVEL